MVCFSDFRTITLPFKLDLIYVISLTKKKNVDFAYEAISYVVWLWTMTKLKTTQFCILLFVTYSTDDLVRVISHMAQFHWHFTSKFILSNNSMWYICSYSACWRCSRLVFEINEVYSILEKLILINYDFLNKEENSLYLLIQWIYYYVWKLINGSILILNKI